MDNNVFLFINSIHAFKGIRRKTEINNKKKERKGKKQ